MTGRAGKCSPPAASCLSSVETLSPVTAEASFHNLCWSLLPPAGRPAQLHMSQTNSGSFHQTLTKLSVPSFASGHLLHPVPCGHQTTRGSTTQKCCLNPVKGCSTSTSHSLKHCSYVTDDCCGPRHHDLLVFPFCLSAVLAVWRVGGGGDR